MPENDNIIIESIREWIKSCPFLDEDYRVNVDFLSEQLSYSVDPLPSASTLAVYADGGKKKQFQFALVSKETYDENARVNIDNSGFYEKFESWVEEQDSKQLLPALSNLKQEPYGIEVLTSGYLYEVDGADALYRIDCRLLYTQDV